MFFKNSHRLKFLVLGYLLVFTLLSPDCAAGMQGFAKIRGPGYESIGVSVGLEWRRP